MNISRCNAALAVYLSLFWVGAGVRVQVCVLVDRNRCRQESMKLEYKDENSGKYECRHSTTELSKIIHVKFRTGENMIELDTPAVVGICVGNIIATILIGVSVYCIAAQPSQRTFSGSKGRSLPNNKTQFTQSIFIIKGQSSDYDQLHIRKK
uniref:Uncharacterized protein n=1 Tax=Denticeps clupeoides TaxID=299321 RepID=A0AAY4EEP1_9TELE